MLVGRDHQEPHLPPGLRMKITRASRLVPAVLAVAWMVPGTGFPGAADGVPSRELCTGYAACDAHGYPSHGYAAHSGTSYWRMTAGDECTNYVAYVEDTVFHAKSPGYLLGDAAQWPGNAAAHGVLVNDKPSVGAVAVWDAGAAGIGAAGHVAVVERVGPHDKYIVISQQHIGSDVDGYDWTRINAGYPPTAWQEWPDQFIHFKMTAAVGIGYYNAKTGTYRLRAALGAGRATAQFRFGGPGKVPLVGDWTGRGSDGTGYYDPGTGTFHLRNKLSAGRQDRVFKFGPRGMIPLVGNWTGRGRRDGIGYYDPRTGTFYLRDKLSAGRPDRVFRFGPPGMIPLVGRWTGGSTGIGYYNPRTGWFHLRDSLSSGKATASFKLGPAGMTPLVGDWTGTGRDSIGYYDQHTGWFHLRRALADRRDIASFRFGPAGMTPLVGYWGRG